MASSVLGWIEVYTLVLLACFGDAQGEQHVVERPSLSNSTGLTNRQLKPLCRSLHSRNTWG